MEDDIRVLSEENQNLNDDITQLLEERASLAQQVQEYVTEVKRVEDVLAQKVGRDSIRRIYRQKFPPNQCHPPSLVTRSSYVELAPSCR